MERADLKAQLAEVAERIRTMREITGLSEEEMAKCTGVSPEEYARCEAGEQDFSFTFIYKCAKRFGVDPTDLIRGVSPTLSSYTIVRHGDGLPITRRHGFKYLNLAPLFKNKTAEPFFVTMPYSEAEQHVAIKLASHAGQEFDIVVRGSMKAQIGSHIEVLNEGDSIYYNSGTPHGMIATGGQDCVFYAIVLEGPGDAAPAPVREKKLERRPDAAGQESRIWEKFIEVEEGEDGSLKRIQFKNADAFNFAFDVVDGLARRKGDKLAMLHVDRSGAERYFTFQDMSRYSSRAANYFQSLGIKRGDRVLLILKRHYQFWFAILGLHKLGAVALLASNQMMEHDLAYRYEAAGISAVVCTSNGQVSYEAERAAAQFPGMVKIMVDGCRQGWHDFDQEFRLFSDEFIRAKDAPAGEDLMLMFFTSGTTGFPKAATQCYKYPLGHFITAKYWHCVDPEGLHLTISDTGWAKAMWGKLYGQWLNEAAVFVYDFDRFDASDILPMFAKYRITTFCAPPTMYRMLIKQDLSRYDLSSVQHATIAGEALNPEVFHQFQKATGLSLMEGFGQSETTVMIGNLVGMRPKVGSMGKPVPLYPVELVDPEGNPVPDGQVGEICIRAERTDICGLFRGYYRSEESTSAAWHDGLYHTGDTAWRDEDGYFWYVGRVDDLIKSSGYRIGPFEIESVIMELPYVLECGVSAAPDEVRGQVVKASIVLVPGTEGTEALKKEIQTYVKEHTAPYKYPRIIVFRDELPKTTSGKIIRNQL